MKRSMILILPFFFTITGLAAQSVEKQNRKPKIAPQHYTLTELAYIDYTGKIRELHAGKIELVVKSPAVEQWFSEVKKPFSKPKLSFAGSINHPQKQVPYLVFSAESPIEIHPPKIDTIVALKVNDKWVTEEAQASPRPKNPWGRPRSFATKYGTFFFPILGEKTEATFTPNSAFYEVLGKPTIQQPEPKPDFPQNVNQKKDRLIDRIQGIVTQFQSSMPKVSFALSADEFESLTKNITDLKQIETKIFKFRYPADFEPLAQKLENILMVGSTILAETVLRKQLHFDLANGIILTNEALKTIKDLKKLLEEVMAQYPHYK